MLAIVDLEERVPQDHPRRRIKEVADAALEWLSPEFDRMYARVGRASVPPERLLKASLLIAPSSVRSERAFCKELEYSLLYRWFLDMDLMERSFDATVFTKNRQRLMAHDVGRALFDEQEATVPGVYQCLDILGPDLRGLQGKGNHRFMGSGHHPFNHPPPP